MLTSSSTTMAVEGCSAVLLLHELPWSQGQVAKKKRDGFRALLMCLFLIDFWTSVQNDTVKHEFPVAWVSSLTWPISQPYYGYSATGKRQPVIDAFKHHNQLLCHLFVSVARRRTVLQEFLPKECTVYAF
jgi:hypothetical protein